jgi:hypothetical protein
MSFHSSLKADWSMVKGGAQAKGRQARRCTPMNSADIGRQCG